MEPPACFSGLARLSPGVTSQAPRVHWGGMKAAGMHSHSIIPRSLGLHPTAEFEETLPGSRHLLFWVCSDFVFPLPLDFWLWKQRVIFCAFSIWLIIIERLKQLKPFPGHQVSLEFVHQRKWCRRRVLHDRKAGLGCNEVAWRLGGLGKPWWQDLKALPSEK